LIRDVQADPYNRMQTAAAYFGIGRDSAVAYAGLRCDKTRIGTRQIARHK
jgi:hypothetical protein